MLAIYSHVDNIISKAKSHVLDEKNDSSSKKNKTGTNKVESKNQIKNKKDDFIYNH